MPTFIGAARSASRSDGQSGALFSVQGYVPRNATWMEDLYFYEGGTPMVLAGLDFKMTFRLDPEQDNADLTLSTAAGTLVVTTDANLIPILQIVVPASSLSAQRGDYTMDLALHDPVTSQVMHLAHGTVTFTRNPVTW